MLQTDDLLKEDPRTALVRIINTYNQQMVISPDSIVIGSPINLGGSLTRVPITRRPRVSGGERPLFGGHISFTYNRIDLGSYFTDPLVFEVPEGELLTSTAIATLWSEKTGYVFDYNDFILEHYSGNPPFTLTLRASPESLRFVGERTVSIVATSELNKAIPNVMLSGFVNYSVKTSLEYILRSSWLNGFITDSESSKLELGRFYSDVALSDVVSVSDYFEIIQTRVDKTVAESIPFATVGTSSNYLFIGGGDVNFANADDINGNWKLDSFQVSSTQLDVETHPDDIVEYGPAMRRLVLDPVSYSEFHNLPDI